MIQLIKENTAEHASASVSVGEAVMRLLENAQKSGEQIPQANAMLTELRDMAETIVAELARFEIAPGGFGADPRGIDREQQSRSQETDPRIGSGSQRIAR